MAFCYGLVVKKCPKKYGYNFIQSHEYKAGLDCYSIFKFFFGAKLSEVRDKTN